MKIIDVLIERKANSLNRPFAYLYDGERNISVGSRVKVNFNHHNLVGYVIKVMDTNLSKDEIEKNSGFKYTYILDVINEEPLLNEELNLLANEMAEYYLCPLISIYQTMLPSSLKPSSSSLKGPKIYYEKYVHLLSPLEDDLTPKQIEIVRNLKNSGDLRLKDVKSQSIIKNLVNKNRIEIIKVEKPRLEIKYEDSAPEKVLTPDQNQAIKSILDSKQSVTLLEGVTGSGKTEIYLALVKEILNANKNVIMLVPEISLTPMMIKMFTSRFKEDVAIFHSDLTNAERYDEYRRISSGKCRVVIGARSAVFAPLNNVGLFILDEEHVESYKQDSLPFYHAREVAIMRAKHFGAKVLLGSATPSLESRARASKGVYNFVRLTKRINEKALPKTSIIDLTNTNNLSNDSAIFSLPLIKALKEIFSKGEQAILLINRRGYSSYLTCRNCGHIFKCPNCGIGLTYHRSNNLLKCHHCGHVEMVSDNCPKCGSTYLSKIGFGTERIVDEMNKLFPQKRVLRLDSDVKMNVNNLNKSLSQFACGEYDCLVGTQMVAKGHDFPNVTLVGVILADIGLALPSFKSAERTFELITQAIGRAGRSDKEGQAIIQTYNSRHYALNYAAKQDYEAFYRQEMRIRQVQKYPPFTYLTAIKLAAKNEALVIDFAYQLFNILAKQNFPETYLVGPITPFIPFIGGKYHREIVIKYRKKDNLFSFLRKMLTEMQKNSQIDIQFDVDTLDF